MASDRIDKFQAASRNLQLQPLLGLEERQRFMVDYGSDCIDMLEQKVLVCDENTNQFVFAGHRGCGKSTLLCDFARKMEGQFFTVFFSISDLIQMNEISHINILFAIALKMMEKAERDHVQIATIRDGNLKKYIEDETSNRIFVMPVLKLYPMGESRKPDGKPNAVAMEILQSVLTRRIDPDLFEAGIEEKIALNSGGVLREVMRITKECCDLILVKLRQQMRRNQNIDDLKIDQGILNEALDNIRNDMKITLSKGDRHILLETYKNYTPDDPKNQDFLDLLHNLIAIEYRNRESWYDVHPLIVEQLKIEKLI